MAASLADSPPAPLNGQAPPDGSVGTPGEPTSGTPPPDAAQRTCAKCGAAMAGDQDWCLQCGAGAPNSIAGTSWRPAAAVLGATAILALGAAAAAYAALTKSTGKAPVVTTTVARVSVPTTTTPSGTPTTSVPGTTSTPTPSAPATPPKTGAGALPGLGAVKPPRIPLTAVTPKAPIKHAVARGLLGTGITTTPKPSTPSSTGGAGASGEESQPTAIVLDTNAASTYNPYNYPASDFGDPSLAIDGDTSTAWSAQVIPVDAPRMAVGLLIDLKAKQKVSALALVTSTPGMTVQVYGSNGDAAPTSITDPAWIALGPPKVVEKKHLRIALRTPTAVSAINGFRFLTVWISRAPASSTPEAPGHVSINEVELFPAS